ncbi:hypothetical protein THMIRHAT_22610 [Thiosulfativibrio zosterae]|uniref:Uncharacterized protein n=2 Tax=Thiosulfativibrio zosterae TaxID=2675053 RepID=A0A6F8PQX5_9GAMM|nr:hypothetical protein THMIRHAT_22610 [Thiosulfativibrio zosterae]
MKKSSLKTITLKRNITFALFGFIIILALIWTFKAVWKNYPLSDKDMATYMQLRAKLSENPKNFYERCTFMDWEHYRLIPTNLKELKNFSNFPTNRQEYLKRKLAYFNESAYHNPQVFELLTSITEQQLAQTPSNAIIEPDATHRQITATTIAIIQQKLPLYERLATLLLDWYSEEPMPEITYADLDALEEAYQTCLAIRTINRTQKQPSYAYILDGGSGKKVPFDGFERDVFKNLITEAQNESNPDLANRYFQALITYQVIRWSAFEENLFKDISDYHAFLVQQPEMDIDKEIADLKTQLFKNNREYGEEYEAFKQRLLSVL